MLPCSAGLAPTPIGPLLGFTIAPGGPEPKSPLGAVSMRVCQSSVMTAVQYPVRSIGARAFAVAGGPPRAPRSCACAAGGRNSHHKAAAIASVRCFMGSYANVNLIWSMVHVDALGKCRLASDHFPSASTWTMDHGPY